MAGDQRLVGDGIGAIVVYAENENKLDTDADGDADAKGIWEKLGEKLNVIGDRERFPEELVVAVIVTVIVTGAVKEYRGLADICLYQVLDFIHAWQSIFSNNF